MTAFTSATTPATTVALHHYAGHHLAIQPSTYWRTCATAPVLHNFRLVGGRKVDLLRTAFPPRNRPSRAELQIPTPR